MSDDLVAMARLAQRDERMSTGALYGDLADRIEELEAKLATCEKYRDAYAECDRIGTQAVRDLEAKLAKATGLIQFLDKEYQHVWGVTAKSKVRATLAELKGKTDD